MNRSRRKFVGRAAAASAAALVAERLGLAAGLLGADHPMVDAKLLPGEKEVWDQVVWMNGLGVRWSGNAAHQKYVQFLEDGFSSAALQMDRIPHTKVTRWDLRRCSVAIASGADTGKELPISSYCRYSATTGPQGVTGALVYCGKISGPSGFAAAVEPNASHTGPVIPADLHGKIALIEISSERLPYGEMWKGHIRGVYNSEGSTEFPAIDPTLAPHGGARIPQTLKADLERAGAAGVIFAWTNLSDDNASGYLRLAVSSKPELWVGQTSGRALRRLADSGGSATLVVEADTVPNVPTHTVLATLPGASDETILVWSHTDGNNAVEENGGIAILNLMKYFSRLPQSARQRTITCVLSEAHFNEQFIPTTAWIKERPDLVAKAVAEVSIEHLGCGEWIDDPVANTHTGNGAPSMGFAFCPVDPLSQVMLDSLQGTNSGKTAVIDTEVNAFSPAIWGYRIDKIPLIGFIVTPDYLLSEAPNGHIDRLNSRRYHEQMIAFANVIHRLDKIPKEQFPPRGTGAEGAS